MTYKAFISITYTVFILCLTTPLVAAQNKIDTDGLLKRCGGYFGLCGYISEPDWKHKRVETEVLPKIYEALGDYNEGLAPVRVKGRWGFMDRNGVMKIDPAYTSVSAFDHGLAVVARETGYGLIDKTGQLRLEPKFTWMVVYSKDRVLASQSDEIEFDPYNSPKRYKEHFRYVSLNHEVPPGGLYDIKSGWLTSSNLKFQNFGAETNGHIWARENAKHSPYGLMDTETGQWHVEPIYDKVRAMSEGLAVVGVSPQARPNRNENIKYGAVDAQGQLVIPVTFDQLGNFWKGFAKARKDGKFALIKKSGKMVADKFFDKITLTHDAEKPRVSQANKYIVKDGQEWWVVGPADTLHPESGYIFLTCPSGLSFEGFMDRVVITHPDGRILGDDFIPHIVPYFPDGEIDRRCDKPISLKSVEGKWGFISPAGEFLADGIEYSNLSDFIVGEGGKKYAGFSIDGVWGVMTETGGIFKEPQFKSYSDLLNNIPGYKHKHKPKTLLFDDGFLVNCSGGSRLFLSNQKWGLQDEDGRVLVKAEHDLITCFSGGTALVPDYELKKWCPIDPKGNRRSDLRCSEFYYPMTRSHSSPESLDPDPWLSNVKWMKQYYEFDLGVRNEPPKWISWR